MPEITVVIPCFNYGRFLDQAVESVLAQSFQDFEIVIVDDGSTDPATQALVDDYQRPKTTVLRTANQGAGAARNAGIRASGGKYVVSLDADDRLHPRYLEKTRELLAADDSRRFGFVTTWARRFGNDSGRMEIATESPADLALSCTVHSASLFRRRVWEEVGGYRESLSGWEDWNLWLNMAGAGYRWQVLPEELFFYRKHGRTRSSRSFEKRPELFEQLLRDNAPFCRQHHQEILATCFRRLVELENEWREKDLALADNRTLARQLADEQESHRQAVDDYRRLEAGFGDLSSSREDERKEREKVAGAYLGLSSDHQKALEEYRNLEAAYLDLSSGLEQAVADYRQLETHCRHLTSSLEAEQEGHRRTLEEYRRLEKYCRGLESAHEPDRGRPPT